MKIDIKTQIDMHDLENDIIQYTKQNASFQTTLLQSILCTTGDITLLDLLQHNIKNEQIRNAIADYMKNQNYKVLGDLIDTINNNIKY
jgi:hypothetical protein